MKITLEQTTDGNDEVIIRYREMNDRITSLIRLLQEDGKLVGVEEGDREKECVFRPEVVYYFESVDRTVYAYLESGVIRLKESLQELLEYCEKYGFFKCSRTMLLNINTIAYLKSEAAGRILATLENKEQIVISRKYARDLRILLKNGGRHDHE